MTEAEVIRTLIRGYRDLLNILEAIIADGGEPAGVPLPPFPEELVPEDTECQHPEDARMSKGVFGDPVARYCTSCGYEYTGTTNEGES